MTATTPDREIGKQIKTLREGLRMSQADLAQELQAAGLAGFYPQTIVKIEQGSRSLKFVEGMVLADIFGVNPDWLLDVTKEEAWDRQVRNATAGMTSAHDRVVHAFNELRQAYVNLGALLEDHEPSEAVRWAVDRAVATSSPERTARTLQRLATTADVMPREPELGEPGHGQQ
jgi:transcriptional regulator with XRE-family HTH domain